MVQFLQGLSGEVGVDAAIRKQVLDAMLRQNGAIPSGASYMNPNFVMENTARFNPNTLTGSGMFNAGSRGALVPTASNGLPALVEGTAIPIAEGTGAAATAAAPAEQTAAKIAMKRGLMTRALGGLGAVAPYVTPAAIAAAPFALDGGQIDATPSSWAAGLNPEGDDLGITSLGKSWMRGNYNVAKWLADNAVIPAYDAVTGLGMTQDERNARDAERKIGDMPPRSDNPVGGNPGIAGGFYGAPGGGQDLSGLEWVIPQGGGGGSNSALDQMLQVVLATKPEKGKIPENLQSDLKNLAFLKSLDWGQPTDGTQLVRTMAAMKGADVQNQLQALGIDTEHGKAMQEWLKEYAKTAVDVEKTKNDMAKDDFKIHRGKNGFLIEMTEGNKKVLKPISSAIFGDDTKGKFKIAGLDFATDNPLKDELTLIQNLDAVGALQKFMLDNKAELADYSKGIIDAKEMTRAQILGIAQEARKSPEVKAALQQMFINSVGQAPNGRPSLEAAPSPAIDELDWLSQLERAQ